MPGRELPTPPSSATRPGSADGSRSDETVQPPGAHPAGTTGRARLNRLLPWPVRRALQLGVIALIVEYLLVPQFAGARAALHLLTHMHVGYLLAALGFELLSLLAFTLATRVLLPPEGRPGLWRLWRIDLATIGLSHAVPGGAAAGTALGYRLLVGAGIPRSTSASVKLTQGVTSAVVLQLLLWSALALAIPLHGSSPLYVTASVVGVVFIALVVGLVAGVHLAESVLSRAADAVTRALPRVPDHAGSRAVARISHQVRQVTGAPRPLAANAGWAALNWLTDAACLWCCLRAFGHTFGYDGLMVPFCLANVAAWIPITPAGLGVVEGLTVPLLVGFGAPRGIVILGVVMWRLMNFWLPIPMGAAAYLSLPYRDDSAAREDQPEVTS